MGLAHNTFRYTLNDIIAIRKTYYENGKQDATKNVRAIEWLIDSVDMDKIDEALKHELDTEDLCVHGPIIELVHSMKRAIKADIKNAKEG